MTTLERYEKLTDIKKCSKRLINQLKIDTLIKS